MDYTTADTIAYRLSKLNPCKFDDSTRDRAIPLKECWFCWWRVPVNVPAEHSPECLWLNAHQYIDLLNAPVASQEPADSPIESRVDELLGETEDGGPEELFVSGKCADAVYDRDHLDCGLSWCDCECHA